MSPVAKVDELVNGGEQGFTLVEMLATMALLSLLSLVLLGSLRFGLVAWERGTSHADRVDHVLLAQDFLRVAIEDAYPRFSTPDPTSGRVEFYGAPASLRFLTVTPRALGGGGRSWTSVSMNRHSARADLVVSSGLELASEMSGPTTKVLLPNIESVDFAYFGKGRSDRVATWRPQWSAETTLPQLVRIRVHFPPRDTRLWPDLVIAPRISVDVSCVYDPLTKQCRGR